MADHITCAVSCNLCLETREITKSLENNNFFQGIWSFLLFQDTFDYGKCLETGEMTKSPKNNDFWIWWFGTESF